MANPEQKKEKGAETPAKRPDVILSSAAPSKVVSAAEQRLTGVARAIQEAQERDERLARLREDIRAAWNKKNPHSPIQPDWKNVAYSPTASDTLSFFNAGYTTVREVSGNWVTLRKKKGDEVALHVVMNSSPKKQSVRSETEGAETTVAQLPNPELQTGQPSEFTYLLDFWKGRASEMKDADKMAVVHSIVQSVMDDPNLKTRKEILQAEEQKFGIFVVNACTPDQDVDPAAFASNVVRTYKRSPQYDQDQKLLDAKTPPKTPQPEETVKKEGADSPEVLPKATVVNAPLPGKEEDIPSTQTENAS